MRETMTEHTYPSNHPPGSYWATDLGWQILDTLPVGVLGSVQRAYLCGLIAGALDKYARDGRPSDAPSPAGDFLTEEMINAAAEVMWNDRDARMGGSWSSRDAREVVVIQTKATARAALLAAAEARLRGEG